MSNQLGTGGDLIQLVYASAATVSMSDAELANLLDAARENNTRLGVTGVLLFKDATFFQVLEGERSVVESLFEKISQDQRHTSVLMLVEEEIEQRNFGQWSMGFVSDASTVETLPGFVDFFDGRTFVDLEGDSRRMRRILDGFRRGRWRRSCQSQEANC